MRTSASLVRRRVLRRLIVAICFIVTAQLLVLGWKTALVAMLIALPLAAIGLTVGVILWEGRVKAKAPIDAVASLPAALMPRPNDGRTFSSEWPVPVRKNWKGLMILIFQRMESPRAGGVAA